MRFVILLIPFLLGCQVAPVYQDPDLKALADKVWGNLLSGAKNEYEISFLKIKHAYISNIEFKFADLESPKIAICTIEYVGFPAQRKPVIMYSSSFWNKDAEIQKEQTMLHELGHCFFELDHDNSTITEYEVTIPSSVMNKNRIPVGLFVKYNDYYYQEMLNRIFQK